MRDAHRARAGEGAPKAVRPSGSPWPRHLFRVRSLSCECKVAGQPLAQAQEREADRLRNSGGVFVVVRELGDLTEALAALEALEGS